MSGLMEVQAGYLTFRNTNTTGTTGTAFTFINGAANDTIRYCNLEAFANATNGVVLFSTSAAVASGNSNILAEYNNINGTVKFKYLPIRNLFSRDNG